MLGSFTVRISNMASKKVSDEQWETERRIWEGDVKVTYADLAQRLGISRQAVAKKASADKWVRNMDLPKVVNKAHQQADRAAVQEDLRLANFAAAGSNQARSVDDELPKTPGAESAPPPLDLTGLTAEQAAEQLAIQKRAEILTRHRTELNGARNRIYEALRKQDHVEGFLMGKRAKILSEALAIVQNAERKAWGLDKGDGDGEKTVVIIDRE